MMHSLFVLSVLCAPILVLGYFYCLSQLYDLVEAERPEWLRYKGEPSIFYAGMPRRFDPNVSLRVLGIVFSSKSRELASAPAVGYAKRIRIILPVSATLIVYIFWYVWAYAGA
jgi:hypothetical protein